jgi:hypothetical protein
MSTNETEIRDTINQDADTIQVNEDVAKPPITNTEETTQAEQEESRQLNEMERRMILAMNIDAKIDEDGIKHYFPELQDEPFPFVMDFTLPHGSVGTVRGMETPFKFTHNVMWSNTSGKPLLKDPEPFPADEFDVRQYLMAYVRTLVQVYGKDITPEPTEKDLETHCSNLATFISRKSKLTDDEAWLISEPGHRFFDQFPDNFITKFIMSLPEAERKEHPLYYQVVFMWLDTTDQETQCYAYMAHADMVTPAKMQFMKALGELAKHRPEFAHGYNLGPVTYAYFDSVMRFIPFTESGPILFPVFRF